MAFISLPFSGYVYHHPDGADLRGLGISLVLRPHPGGHLLPGGRWWTSRALDLHVEEHQRPLPGME